MFIFQTRLYPRHCVDWTNKNVSFGARNHVSQRNVARFVHEECSFEKIKDIFQRLHRTLSDTFTSASMSLVQIKVIYDYYSSKRVTPFFIGEEELLECDFKAFKERLVREVPHLAKITSLSAAPLRNNE